MIIISEHITKQDESDWFTETNTGLDVPDFNPPILPDHIPECFAVAWLKKDYTARCDEYKTGLLVNYDDKFQSNEKPSCSDGTRCPG